MDFKILQAFLDQYPDLIEGITSIVTKKTDRPDWKFNNVFEVDRKDIDTFLNYPSEINLQRPEHLENFEIEF